MSKPAPFSFRFSIRQFIWLFCLILLVGLMFPAMALADGPAGAEPCTDCHEAETSAWQTSPHARVSHARGDVVGATCEDCHGQYVEDHPDAGVMQLTVDSSVCQNCHKTTFAQWKSSKHAEANVQCIGCHLSHSQQFRLTDDALCGACHRDRLVNYENSTHGIQGVRCTDCHLEAPRTYEVAMAAVTDFGLPLAANQLQDDGVRAPRHDFTEVSPENCIACHQQELHESVSGGCAKGVSLDEFRATSKSVSALTTRLKTLEAENRSLRFWAPAALGIGLGIGGMLGVVVMLIFGYINRRRAEQ